MSVRFACGSAVEIRRMKPGADKKPMAVWESGAVFSHYTRAGEAVVTHPDGTPERFPDGSWLRPDDLGAKP